MRIASTLAVILAVTAAGGEFVGSARVVKVEPLAEDVAVERDCPSARPSAEAGLAATLRWDLCRPARNTRARGYRVFYEWDNQVYERIMVKAPGRTVPVRVSLD